MPVKTGADIVKESQDLAAAGKDPNQIANILCGQDPSGCNYGIGIVLDGQGQPMASSPTLLHFAKQEIENSGQGTYLNSAKNMVQLTKEVLAWQRIPEKHWDNFILVLPSDAGTGAVQTAVQLSLILNPNITTLGIEELGWPAYKAIANAAGLGTKEFPMEAVINGAHRQVIYQAGPMNTTGFFQDKETIENRATVAAQDNQFLILDRAYSGFEYATDLKTKSYDDIMKASYDLQINPYIENGVSFALSLSPTKAFVTFALRPCGLLLIYCPKGTDKSAMGRSANRLIRARGSSFEHAVTRAFVKALLEARSQLEKEHEAALKRLADVQTVWQDLVKGTKMESLFSQHYAGLFRNPVVAPNAAEEIYEKHLYPVFSQNHCRLNITGLPDDKALAEEHVSVFSKYCS